MLPRSALLALARASFEEREGRLDEARAAFETLLSAEDVLPSHFIARMRLGWRAGGAVEGRAVFARARRHACCSWEVYAAAAHLEGTLGAAPDAAAATPLAAVEPAASARTGLTISHSEVARRIYVLALERFPTVLSLRLEYARWLRSSGETVALRAHLEASLERIR